ncbi:uncharacterized protein LOC130420335 [Triplophysa dalaica]|uniref:uncharacterized protein LOC130420335 n=1 Tax=Triplophysa dalaica TaxID=1582913 RepID=UPI0024DFA997|nr:uncharacterized protein LOC130420335 [Triplophysa dalaica]XP_056603519.1 uncharacterized protein LOC130420335 [Triplophysa dalaica]XP_056603520.1 uncharacterized protein LOC130420335 [Triplophysa dalaica]
MLLRVVLSDMDIRRLSIEITPPSVDALCQVLRANLGLRGGFILQFEDPAFKDQLTNLTDIRDLPEERATLKVLFTADAACSDSKLDSASLPSLSSRESDSQHWPEPFPIPEFSHDVELTLQEANGRYAKDGSVLVIPKGMKSDILDTLADSMSKISPYPERQHYENVAKALVEKHPSLKEPGSGKGWYGWFHSLKFKLGNYRQKLSAAGCPEVRVNKRKGEEAKGPRMKKSKKGEVHFCPDPPEGLSDEDMEEKRMLMEVEVLKKDPDHQQIDELMSATFSKRRKEIVGDQPIIGDVIARWPAMFCERQVRTEFKRVVSIDLLESFLDGLDDLAPRLLEVYEAATKSAKMPALKAILDCLKKDDTNNRRRIAALLGLPHYLREEPSDIIRMCDAHGETLAAAMEGMQLGLLIGHEGDNQDAFPREVFNVAVVVEETVVLHNFKDVPSSFAMLLGIIYCVNLEYPRAMKYSFEFLQRVVMKIKPDQASARVHGIRNKLLRYNL